MTNGSHNRLRDGIFWSAFERFAVQGLQFIVFVFMARALNPYDYGLVGMLSFFIIISHLIAEGGLSQAIIRKLDHDEKDLSTSFYVNVLTGLLLYAILYACAPAIAGFYDEPALKDLLRVMALCIIVQSTLVVHRSVLTSRLDFKTQAKSTLVGAIFSGFVGIYMAYNGFRAWSLVGFQLTNQITTAASLWIVTDWHPKLIFSTSSFKALYGYGCKLLMSKIIDNIYNSVSVLVIGKVFSAYALGSYTNARQLGSVSSENFTRIVNRAAFPMFCNFQAETTKLRSAIHGYLRLSIFVIGPLMMGLATLALPLTTALIGQQWVYTARLLRILCVFFIFYPLNSINFMILEILGRGTAYLRLHAINAVVGLALLALLIPYGLSAVCLGLLGTAAITYAANATVAGGRIGIGLLSQLRAIAPILLISLVMTAVMYASRFIIHGDWPQVIIGSLAGLLTYVSLSLVFLTTLCRRFASLFSKHQISNQSY